MSFFLTATLAISAIALLPFALLSPGVIRAFPAVWPLLLVARAAPSLAALLAAARDGGSLAVGTLLRGLTPRVRDLPWILAAAVVPCALAMSATGYVLTGGMPPGPVASEALRSFPGILAGAFLGAGLGEELGWRGYALPRLQRHLRPVAAALVVGALAFGWHRLLERAEGLPFGETPLVIALGTGLAQAVGLAWLYNRTGGRVLVCAAGHAGIDAARLLFERAVPLVWLGGNADIPWLALWTVVALALALGTRGTLGLAGAQAAQGEP